MNTNENYLNLCGTKIPLTDEQVRELKESLGKRTRLGDVNVGDTFKLGKYEFIVLKHIDGITHVLLKGLLCKSAFGEGDCDFKKSLVKPILEDFTDKIASIVGLDNIIPHLVDLTSNDGLTDYGTVTERMSLLTTDKAREHVHILDKYKLDAYWWLVTPLSTPTHNYSKFVCCGSPHGIIYYDLYSNDDNGVRPFCILNSDIFVS